MEFAGADPPHVDEVWHVKRSLLGFTIQISTTKSHGSRPLTKQKANHRSVRWVDVNKR